MPAPSPQFVTVILLMLLSIVGAWIWVVLRLMFRLPVLPPDTPRSVPWGAGSVLAVFLSWLVVGTLIATGYLAWLRHDPARAGADGRPELSPAEMMTLSAIQNGLSVVLIPLVLAATSGARLRDLADRGPGLRKQAIWGMVAFPLLAPVVFGTMALAVRLWGKTNHPLQDAIAQEMGPGMAIILVLAGVVCAPLAEELIFRGVLLGWLTRLALRGRAAMDPGPTLDGVGEFPSGDRGEHLLETVEVDRAQGAAESWTPPTAEQPFLDPYAPPRTAVQDRPDAAPASRWALAIRLAVVNVVVSAIFAALHGKVWPTPIPIFFLSLGLGFLYQRTGSIIAPVSLHMTFNGLNTLMMFVSLGGTPVPKPGVPVPEPIPVQAGSIVPGKIYSGPAH